MTAKDPKAPQLDEIGRLSPMPLLAADDAMSSSPPPPQQPTTPNRAQDLLAGRNSPFGDTVARRSSRGVAGLHLVDLQTQIEALSAENEALKKDKKDLKEALAATQDDQVKQAAALKDLHRLNDQLQQHVDSMRTTLNMKEQATQSHFRETSNLRRASHQQAEKNTEIRKERDALRASVDKLKRFTDIMMRLMTDQTNEISRWKTLFAEYKELVADYLEDLNSVSRERLGRTEDAISKSMEIVEEARTMMRNAKTATEGEEMKL